MTMRKYFGISLQRMPGSDGKMYLAAVVWYYRGRQRLGYFYPSIRWF